MRIWLAGKISVKHHCQRKNKFTVTKKATVELGLPTNSDLLLMVGKGIRGVICHAIYRLAVKQTINR